MIWKNKDKDVFISKKSKKIIPKSCFVRDKVFDMEDNDHLNIQIFHLYHVGLRDG